MDEQYDDEWGAKEKVLKLCNYFMFVQWFGIIITSHWWTRDPK